jgi:hypothetical protein
VTHLGQVTIDRPSIIRRGVIFGTIRMIGLKKTKPSIVLVTSTCPRAIQQVQRPIDFR